MTRIVPLEPKSTGYGPLIPWRRLFRRRKLKPPPPRPVRILPTEPPRERWMVTGLGDTFQDELIRHLYWWYGSSGVDRHRARWVMSGDWLEECMKLAPPLPPEPPQWAKAGDPPPKPLPPQIFGMPVEVRDGAGPPHLEA